MEEAGDAHALGNVLAVVPRAEGRLVTGRDVVPDQERALAGHRAALPVRPHGADDVA